MKSLVIILLMVGGSAFADQFELNCQVTSCDRVGPPRNGSGTCTYITQWQIEAHFTVNTLMEGVAKPGTIEDGKVKWLEADKISGVFSAESAEFEAKGSTDFPIYIYIPNKVDASTGRTELDPDADGYILKRPANFGAAFHRDIVRCKRVAP